ncbi:MAG: ATP-binding protein [Bacteroidetes bacterium]|nr:ATP-binding protein [Bacteroidota bacterium]
MLKLHKFYTGIVDSKELFSIFTGSSLVGVAIFNNGKIIYADDKISEIVCIPKDKLIGSPLESFYHLVHPDDLDYALNYFSSQEHVKPLKLRYRSNSSNGLYLWHEVRMNRVKHGKEVYTVAVMTEIDKQKSYEDLLIQNERKYKSFIEQTSEGISYLEFAIPVDTREPADKKIENIYKYGFVSECNLAFAKMYGFENVTDVIGKKLIEFHGNDHNPLNIKAFIDLFESGYNIRNIITEELTADGKKTIFLNNSIGIIKDDMLLGIWGTQIDITERQKSHELVTAAYSISEAAHESENLDELFRSIHSNVATLMPAKNFYIAIYDKEKDLISFPYFVDEYDEAAITQKPGRGITEYVIRTGKPLLATPEIIKRLEEAGEIIAIGSVSIDWLGVPLKIDDVTIGLIAVQSYTEGVRYTVEDMNILEFVSTQVAMTIERKRSEDALKQSESKNRALLSALPDLMFVQDYDGIYLDYHTRNPEILYTTPENFLGKNMKNVLPAYLDRLFRDAMGRAINTGEIVLIEYPLNISGEVRYFEARLVAFDNDKILSTIRDVSQKVKMVRELLEAKEKAEEMNKLKTNFLANMSHELRTPLHGILGFAQILAEESMDEEQRNMIMTIYRSGKRLLETLNLILNFSRVDANKYELVYSIVNVSELVAEVTNLFLPTAENKSIILSADMPKDSLYAELDERLLRDILNNLINNAVKFTEKGSVTVKLRSSRSSFIIEVADTGIGIPEDKYDVIFQEFRQESEGLSRNFEGTGLGLTLTKNYVELMKGSIKVESEVRKGTKFTVTLPVNIATDSFLNVAEEKLEYETEIIPSPSVKKKILLVENDKVSAVLVKTYISKSYEVTTVTNGFDAVKSARENMFDAVLMDINLGEGLTGIQATQEIKNMKGYESVPIIAVTAFAMETDKDEFLKVGCSHYIAKPFDKSELLNLLNSIFSGQA